MSRPPAPRIGIDYLPDDFAGAAPASRRTGIVMLLVFVALFGALHFGWEAMRDSAAAAALVHHLAVRPGALLIHALTPDLGAYADGARIRAPGGGINILNGCDGMDVLFMVVAGFGAVALSWRRRLVGMALGVLLVLALNTSRIASLFYAYRADRHIFDLLHTLVWPVALVALVALYFNAVIRSAPATTG